MISDGMGSSDGINLSLQKVKKFKFSFETELYFSDAEDMAHYLKEAKANLEEEFNAKNISIEEVPKVDLEEIENSQGA